MIYIGYYRDRILAVSKNKKDIKRYLKDIRCLKKHMYEIREILLDMSSAEDMYYKYILDDWNGLMLPRRDIITLEDDIKCELRAINYTKDLMLNLYKMLNFNKSFREDKLAVKESVQRLDKILSSDNKLGKLKATIAFHSPIFSSNIDEYLKLYELYSLQKELDYRYRFCVKNDE